MSSSPCIICSDVCDGVEQLVATPCGHVYHSACLLKWLNTNKTCPECRRKLLRKEIIELRISTSPLMLNEPGYTSNDVQNIKISLEEYNSMINRLAVENSDLKTKIAKDNMRIHSLEKDNNELQNRLNHDSMKEVPNLLRRIEKQTTEIEQLKNELSQFDDINTIINETQKEAEQILNFAISDVPHPTDFLVSRRLATYYSVLKNDIDTAIDEVNQLKAEAIESNNNVDLTSRMETTLRDLADGTWQKMNRKIDHLFSAVRRKHFSEHGTEFNDTFDPQPSTSSYSPCRNYNLRDIPEITYVVGGYEQSKKRKLDVLDQEREKLACKQSVSPLHFSLIESCEKETDSVSNIDTTVIESSEKETDSGSNIDTMA